MYCKQQLLWGLRCFGKYQLYIDPPHWDYANSNAKTTMCWRIAQFTWTFQWKRYLLQVTISGHRLSWAGGHTIPPHRTRSWTVQLIMLNLTVQLNNAELFDHSELANCWTRREILCYIGQAGQCCLCCPGIKAHCIIVNSLTRLPELWVYTIDSIGIQTRGREV